jgi:hypothetical protein
VTVCAAALSIALLVSALWGKRIATVQLHGFVWAAVLINAAVIGLLSEPQHRYGARVAWLLPLAVLLSLSEYARDRARAPRRGAPAASAAAGATPDGGHLTEHRRPAARR